MIIVYHVISQEHVIKDLSVTYGWEPLMVSHQPAKFGKHMHCRSRDMMFLVAEEEDSTCFRFNPPFLFISNGLNLISHIILY